MIIQITLLYAGILGFLLTALSFNVMHHWVRVTGAGQETDQAMRRAERLLVSFVEYVPMSLLLLLLMELKGAPAEVLHILGIALVAARIMHAYGSNNVLGAGWLRFFGAQLTFLIVMVASLACIYFYAFGRV